MPRINFVPLYACLFCYPFHFCIYTYRTCKSSKYVSLSISMLVPLSRRTDGVNSTSLTEHPTEYTWDTFHPHSPRGNRLTCQEEALGLDQLDPREQEIIFCLWRYITAKDIADRLKQETPLCPRSRYWTKGCIRERCNEKKLHKG